jgi:hypothetical protein
MKRVGMWTADNPEQPELDWPNGPGVMGVIENKALFLGDTRSFENRS